MRWLSGNLWAGMETKQVAVGMICFVHVFERVVIVIAIVFFKVHRNTFGDHAVHIGVVLDTKKQRIKEDKADNHMVESLLGYDPNCFHSGRISFSKRPN